MRELGAYFTAKRLIGEATRTTSPAAVVIDLSSTNARPFDGISLLERQA